MSLITIDQLLESVDLDFEPRFITQDEDGDVWIWNTRPDKNANWCLKKGTPKPFRGRFISECLKLAEFDGKDWTECIYEVPRKIDEQNLEKTRPADSDLVYRVKLPRKTTGNEIEQKMLAELERKLNAIVDTAIDAVNELKGAKNE